MIPISDFLELCRQADAITFRPQFGTFLLWVQDNKPEHCKHYDVTTYEMSIRKYKTKIRVNGLQYANNWGYYGTIDLIGGERFVSVDEATEILNKTL